MKKLESELIDTVREPIPSWTIFRGEVQSED
jgi:hypothetical protein